MTTEANCGVTGGSVKRPSDADGDVAQGTSLPESVTTRVIVLIAMLFGQVDTVYLSVDIKQECEIKLCCLY